MRLSPPTNTQSPFNDLKFKRYMIQMKIVRQGIILFDHLFVIFLFFLDFVAYWSLKWGHQRSATAHAPKPHSIGLPLYFKTNSLRFSLIKSSTKYFIFQQKKRNPSSMTSPQNDMSSFKKCVFFFKIFSLIKIFDVMAFLV